MEKGVIMGLESNYLVMMTKEGRFCKGKKINSSFEIGQEIFFEPYEEVAFLQKLTSIMPKLRPVFIIATLLIFVLASLPVIKGFNQPNVMAFVNMDINPSLELGLDGNQEVITLNALNADGEKVKKSIKDWKGKTLNQVATEIINVSEDSGYLKEDKNILFTTTVVDNKDLNDNYTYEEKIEAVVNKIENKEAIQAITMVAEKAQYDKAKKEGLSVGKYVLYKHSKLSKKEAEFSSVNKLVEKVPNIEDITKEQKDHKYKGFKKYEKKKGTVHPNKPVEKQTQPVVVPEVDLNKNKVVPSVEVMPQPKGKSENKGNGNPKVDNSNKPIVPTPKIKEPQQPKSNNNGNGHSKKDNRTKSAPSEKQNKSTQSVKPNQSVNQKKPYSKPKQSHKVDTKKTISTVKKSISPIKQKVQDSKEKNVVKKPISSNKGNKK